jgi:L-tyrosine peroxygenase
VTAGDIIEALPVPSRWDFGGHPYGLEPLTLSASAPESAVGGEDCDTTPDEDLESSRKSLLALGSADGEAGPPIPDPIERIFWFRWITGHQTTFILWQLLARAMARDGVARAAGHDSCSVFVRGYSAMLLYTGSCPRGIYQQVIRPSMALQHPGFSGSWARDFWPVRGLLGPRAMSAPADSRLRRECELNGLIHSGIAAKLVPDGASLLQTAAGQKLPWRRSTLAVLYDTYFLTLRAPIPYQAVVRQLMRRLHAIGRDLAANGLYPLYASSAEERPPGLRTAQVEQCECSIPETLFEIATKVAETGWHAWEVQ